jgi:hypothetical protein
LQALVLSVVCAVAAVGSPAARADGIALAVNLPDNNAMHRDFAAGFVSVVAERFRLLAPQLLPADTVACRADLACLAERAKERGASHLLTIGIAALGPRDVVVSMKLLDVERGTEIFGYSDVATPGLDARGAGRALGQRELQRVRGMAPPLKRDVESGVVEDAPRVAPPTALSWAGMGLVGLSVALVATSAAVNIAHYQAAAVGDRGAADGGQTDDIALWGVGTGLVLAGGGAALFVVDELVTRP